MVKYRVSDLTRLAGDSSGYTKLTKFPRKFLKNLKKNCVSWCTIYSSVSRGKIGTKTKKFSGSSCSNTMKV